MRLLLALALLLAPAVPAAPAPTLLLDVPLGEDAWAAFRFNLSGASDLAVRATWTGCRDGPDGFESVLGVSWTEIQDGAPRLRLLAPGQLGWGGDVAEAGAFGVVARTPTLTTQRSCDGSQVSFWPEGKESLVVLVTSIAPYGRVQVAATWTHGVASWDVATGEARTWTKNDFERGAHANVYPAASAEAGALLAQRVEASRDLVGWFWPDSPHFGPGVTAWRCARDGGACPAPDAAGVIPLASRGPVAWDFEVSADARVRDPPYHLLGVVELPDASYLR